MKYKNLQSYNRTKKKMGLGVLALLTLSQHPDGLTLTHYADTASAGRPLRTEVVPGLSFSLDTTAEGSAELSGSMVSVKGQRYAFECDFGPHATFGILHIDDHLVCQLGANVGAGCGAPGQHNNCNSTDNPLVGMTRSLWPVRMTVIFRASPGGIKVASLTQYHCITSLGAELTSLAGSCHRLPPQPRRALRQPRHDSSRRFLRSSFGGVRFKDLFCKAGASSTTARTQTSCCFLRQPGSRLRSVRSGRGVRASTR